VTFPVSIGPEEASALRDWVEREDARRTIEVGLGYGVSTVAICEGLVANGGGRHVAIDPYQHIGLQRHATKFEGAGLRALDDAGLRELVEFHEEESQIVLPRLLAEGRAFDVAFVDGNHRFESVFLDLIYSGRLLDERRIVFVDDTQLPAIRRALDFCLANLGWTVEGDGAEGDVHEWLVVRTGPAAAFERPYADFVDFF
jgi:predicted O-methyltransferase YrrM